MKVFSLHFFGIKIRWRTRLVRVGLLGIMLLSAVPDAMAQAGSTAQPDSTDKQSPQRLSDWLSERTLAADDYPLGLVWRVPGEEAAQEKSRDSLLQAISASKGDADAVRQLHDWIAGLPITGRVLISIVDADWLRANPQHDPVILAGQSVVLPKRPHTITLVASSGARCQLPHVAGWLSGDYLSRCAAVAAHQADWAWVIQPDGKVRRFGIASWNVQQQDEPAPGAWIWIPLREDQWAVDLSAPLAAFLATQGAAPETDVAAGAVDAEVSSANKVADNDYDRDAVVTANDWGEAGLLQTPTARMRVTGSGSMTLARAIPYNYVNIFLQPFSWAEFGFRYTGISDRLYDPAIAGTQSYKDKSMDLKLGLLDESAYLPQVAVGFRDMLGTGLFSGEYLVANKRLGTLDASLGLGWGYVGGRGNMGNPLTIFGSSFATRATTTGQTGEFATSRYFHGPTALFGGVQYHTSWDPLILKLEYDGNNYQHEPLANNLRQDSPWNFAAVYRAGPSVELSAGIERGNTFMLGITLQTDLKRLATPKLDDPPPVPVSPIPPRQSAIGATTAHDLTEQTGWPVRSIQQQGRALRVNVDDADSIYWRERLERANAVLNRDAPASIDDFDFVYRQRDMALVEQQVDRYVWLRQQMQPVPPAERKDAVVTRPAIETASTDNKSGQNGSTWNESSILYRGKPPAFQFEPDIGLNYSLGGPNSFVLYEIAAEGNAQWRWSDDTWMQGSLQYDLLDNYNKFTYTAPSNLPRVRTYIRQYLTTSKVTMPDLQLTNTGKLSENQYYSLYGGYLEMMFAGVGAEWLYRSYDSPLALGIDVNRVRQRDFRQDFYLDTYQVTTGHATIYWDTGWKDVQARISAGRYLAGDVGATIDLSRVFRNGVRMGGFLTKTNVSAQQFGEGSYDKGIYVTIPFDAMMTRSSHAVGKFLWQPLIRDGGAMLDRQVRLYDMTRLLDSHAMQYQPANLGNSDPAP